MTIEDRGVTIEDRGAAIEDRCATQSDDRGSPCNDQGSRCAIKDRGASNLVRIFWALLRFFVHNGVPYITPLHQCTCVVVLCGMWTVSVMASPPAAITE